MLPGKESDPRPLETVDKLSLATGVGWASPTETVKQTRTTKVLPLRMEKVRAPIRGAKLRFRWAMPTPRRTGTRGEKINSLLWSRLGFTACCGRGINRAARVSKRR